MQDSFAILEVFLRQDSGNNIVRGICFHYGFKGGVKVLQNWGSTESSFEFIEYLLTLKRPLKRVVLFQQVEHRLADSGISFNKASVEVGESKKALEVSDTGGRLPVLDSRDLFGVHLDTIRGDNKAKEGSFCCIKFAFFRFNI